MPRFLYSSNNSGGDWWLDDDDWLALEAAGWDVEWCKDSKCDFVQACLRDGRFIGALATFAEKDFRSLADAVAEFEAIIGEDTTAEGCECCGPPHFFSEVG